MRIQLGLVVRTVLYWIAFVALFAAGRFVLSLPARNRQSKGAPSVSSDEGTLFERICDRMAGCAHRPK